MTQEDRINFLKTRIEMARQFVTTERLSEHGFGMDVVDADAVMRILDGDEPW